MSIFKRALQKKLRFSTTRGELNTERLFDFTSEQGLKELDTLYKNLYKKYNESGSSVSLLNEVTTKDRVLRLKLDVLEDVVKTILANKAKAFKANETREENQRLLALRKDSQMSDMERYVTTLTDKEFNDFMELSTAKRRKVVETWVKSEQ